MALRWSTVLRCAAAVLLQIGPSAVAAPAGAPAVPEDVAPQSLTPTLLQPQFRVYTTADGLPSTQVRALRQDRDGLLWIATFGGLASFDGRRFRQWRPPDDPRPLVSETLMEDSDGTLWIAVERRGLYALDRSRQHWRHYSTLSAAEDQRLGTDDVWALLPDPSGGFWFGGYGGGLQHMDAAGRVRSLADSMPALLPIAEITALARDRLGGLWLGSPGGLWHWTASTATLARCAPLGNAGMIGLWTDATGVWAVASDGQLRHFSVLPNAPACTLDQAWQAEVAEQFAQSLLIHEGQLQMIGLRSGLAWPGLPGTPASPGLQTLRWLPARFGVRGGLPAAPATALLKDREGGLWVGHFGGGLAWLPPPAGQWSAIVHDPANPGGLNARAIRGLARDAHGRLWVGSNDAGLEWIDPQLNAAQRWPHAASLGPGRHAVQAIAVVDDQLWVGTRRFLWHGQLDPSGLHFRGRIDALPNVHVLLRQGEDLWAAVRADALYRLDARSGAVKSRFPPGALAGDEVSQLLLDPRGALWVASDGGLQRFDRLSGKLDFGQPINHGDVASLCFRDGQLWRYVDARLEAWDLDGRVLHASHARADGIPALDTVQLLCADSGVWLLTATSLLKFDPRLGRAEVRAEAADGLPPIELGARPYAEPDGARVWVGGDGGLLGLDKDVPVRPLPAVGFALAPGRNRVQRGDAWTPLSGDQLTLQPDDRNLRVSARSIQFWRADATRYLFILGGPTGVERFERATPVLELPRLQPGSYRLTLDADHPRLGRALSTHAFDLTVLPPWWTTWWAQGLGVLLALFSLALVFQRSRLQLKRRHARQLEQQRLEFAEHIAEEKSRFLAQTSHEMSNLLGGASGVAGLIEAQAPPGPVRHKAGKLVELCADLMRLLDDLLENARLERGQIKLDCQTFSLHAALDDTVSRQFARARDKGLATSVEISTGGDLRIGDALRLRQIVTNLLSNAVKYTEHGRVRLIVSEGGATAAVDGAAVCQASDWLVVHVIDTGPGLVPGARKKLFQPFALGTERRDSTGLGLAICAQLVRLAGGSIDVHSDAGGTRFSVQLPWPRAATPVAAGTVTTRHGEWLLVGETAATAPWRAALAAAGAGWQQHDTLLGLCAALKDGDLAAQSAGILLPEADDTTIALAQAVLTPALVGTLPVHCPPRQTEAGAWIATQATREPPGAR